MSPIDITKEHNRVIISRNLRIHRIQSRDWYRQRFFTEHWFRMKRAKIRAQEAFQRIKRKKRNAIPSHPPRFIPHISSLFLPFFEKTCSLTCARRQSRATHNRGGQSVAYWVPVILFSRWFTRETRGEGEWIRDKRKRTKGSGKKEEMGVEARRSSPCNRPKISFIGSRVTRFSGNLVLRSVARTRPRFNDKRLKGRKLWCYG